MSGNAIIRVGASASRAPIRCYHVRVLCRSDSLDRKVGNALSDRLGLWIWDFSSTVKFMRGRSAEGLPPRFGLWRAEAWTSLHLPSSDRTDVRVDEGV